ETGTGFYDDYSDWDMIWIPIMAPVKAYKLNSDEWKINTIGFIHKRESVILGDIPVFAFGVTNDFIYGFSKYLNTSTPYKWFVYSPNNLIYATYDTKSELLNTLQSLEVKVMPIKPCEDYYKSLTKGDRCYWFPKPSEEYPTFTAHQPNSTIDIQVIGDENGIDFIVQDVKRNDSKIYFFKMKYDKPDNDLFYVSINHSSPKLIKNNVVVLTCPWSNTLDIAVYTPYPVGQQKNIKKEDRIVINKTIQIVDK
ncbi:MAG: hypothetical protein ACI8SE_001304, partial [Bacteroidia bacterium]